MASRQEDLRRALDFEFSASDSSFDLEVPFLEPEVMLTNVPDRDVLQIFIEGQRKSNCPQTRYDLLDERWQKRNPLCPAEIVEDDYSEDSRP